MTGFLFDIATIQFNVNLMKRLTIHFYGVILAIIFAVIACTSVEKNPEQTTAFLFVNQDEKAMQIAFKDKDGNFTYLEDTPFSHKSTKRFGEKRAMKNAYLFKTDDNLWHCIWSFEDAPNKFAHQVSPDLIAWHLQNNVLLPDGFSFDFPIVKKVKSDKYDVFFKNKNDVYKISTSNFSKFTTPEKLPTNAFPNEYKTLLVSNKKMTGTLVDIDNTTLAKLKEKIELNKKNKFIISITPEKIEKFLGKKKLTASLSIDTNSTKKISKNLIGIFYEDVNYAADGGLYGELIQNRDFEYSNWDRKNWTATTAWKKSEKIDFNISSKNPIHNNNRNYAVLRSHSDNSMIVNNGWSGIKIEKNATYNFSIFVKKLDKFNSLLTVRLADENGKIASEILIENLSNDWQKREYTLQSTLSCNNAQLQIIPQKDTQIAIDMVSLFPTATFKNRKNGLRKDLAEAVANLKPKFVRFPGGCLVHGRSLNDAYNWKNSIGKLEERKHQPNLWGYHQTKGLGYLEYFQMCEDFGAEPIPVVPAGISCQYRGKMQVISLEDLPNYIQDIFDLIEFANGDAKTTKWGKIRAENGHPQPFNLKYLAVGNEEEINEEYCIRYEIIQKAINEKYPEIIVIGNSGPGFANTDYYAGWDLSKRLKTPIVDEHYYMDKDFLITHQFVYDSYSRNAPKVFLGEYATHNKQRTSDIECALHSAIHLVNIERNADHVIMASYAPLFGRKNFCQWNPNMIYFDHAKIYLTTDYYVQKMFGNNTGDTYINSSIKINTENIGIIERLKASVVEDSKTGDIIIKIVNILPREVEITLNLPMLSQNSTATKRVLSGKLNQLDAIPVESSIKVCETLVEKIAPNSLTILRFKK